MTDLVMLVDNLPVPAARRGRKPRWPFYQMEVGESFSIHKIEADRARVAASIYGRKSGRTFRSRIEGNAVRFWRVS